MKLSTIVAAIASTTVSQHAVLALETTSIVDIEAQAAPNMLLVADLDDYTDLTLERRATVPSLTSSLSTIRSSSATHSLTVSSHSSGTTTQSTTIHDSSGTISHSTSTHDSPSTTKIGSVSSARSLHSTAPCPAVWSTVAADLQADFANCSQDASMAIRFAFHDSAGYSIKNTPSGPASGGADGSLLLNKTEAYRSEHNPMGSYYRYLLGKYTKYQSQGLGAADLIQFASSIAIASCPGGSVITTVVGRIDDATAAPMDLLPQAFGDGAAYDVLIQLFADKGFNPQELAALMGAHSVSRAFVQTSNGIPVNSPQDSTPEVMDVTYYSQTQANVAPDGVYRFDSDVNLANASTISGQAFAQYAKSRDNWVIAFSQAMYKLSLLGIPQAKIDGFADCTAVVRSAVTQ